MKHETVRATAFAMPLTNPAFPPGPYRFINRDYFIIQYRTDPEALRRIVREPLELTEPGGNSVIARSSCDEAIQFLLLGSWIASLRSQ
ncbi:MAG: acetoacetate decarboxylase [Tardiphaga sp.]|nr:acetoacetate decarboxylase [Tardiphaga sp.]